MNRTIRASGWLRKNSQNDLNVIGVQDVVVGNNGDDLAPGRLYTHVTRGGYSLMLVVQPLDACVRRAVSGNKVACAVVRSVVGNQNFQHIAPGGLREQRIKAILQQSLAIISKHDDRNGFRRHLNCPELRAFRQGKHSLDSVAGSHCELSQSKGQVKVQESPVPGNLLKLALAQKLVAVLRQKVPLALRIA